MTCAQKEVEQNERNPFQRLIFLIRDFDFPDYEYGYHDNSKSTTERKNFCRDVFIKTSAGVEKPPESVFVREEIQRSYKDVSCFLMPYPGRQFARDDSKPTDPDFEVCMKEFVEILLSPANLETKRIGEQEVTGNEFKR